MDVAAAPTGAAGGAAADVTAETAAKVPDAPMPTTTTWASGLAAWMVLRAGAKFREKERVP